MVVGLRRCRRRHERPGIRSALDFCHPGLRRKEVILPSDLCPHTTHVMGSECMRHHHTNGPQTAQAQLPRTEQGCSPRSLARGELETR
eukprot:scaffold16723_cov143-Isochrysis_galbana.AAC.15